MPKKSSEHCVPYKKHAILLYIYINIFKWRKRQNLVLFKKKRSFLLVKKETGHLSLQFAIADITNAYWSPLGHIWKPVYYS